MILLLLYLCCYKATMAGKQAKNQIKLTPTSYEFSKRSFYCCCILAAFEGLLTAKITAHTRVNPCVNSGKNKKLLRKNV